MPLPNRFDSRRVSNRPIARRYRLQSECAFHIGRLGRHPVLEGMRRHASIDRRFPMRAHLTNRLANYCASLLLALLILSVVSAARADNDDGIVRLKSAVPMAEAITRIKADIASKGIKFFMEID